MDIGFEIHSCSILSRQYIAFRSHRGRIDTFFRKGSCPFGDRSDRPPSCSAKDLLRLQALKKFFLGKMWISLLLLISMSRFVPIERIDIPGVLREAKAKQRPVVLKLHRRGCPSCRVVVPRLEQIARRFQDVEYYEILVDYKANPEDRHFCDTLGVTALPFVFVISNRVSEGFVCALAQTRRLVKLLEALYL